MVTDVFRQQKIRKAGLFPPSLLEAIAERPDSFVKDIRGNPRIKDFGTFVQELRGQFAGNNAETYIFQDLDKEILRILFNSDTVRTTIERNIGREEADKLYRGEVQQTLPTAFVQTAPSVKAPAVGRAPFQQVPIKRVGGFTRKTTIKGRSVTQSVRGYQRSAGMRWTSAQVKFLQVRKAKGMTPAQIVRQFNQKFPANQRSYESVRKKHYRI